MFAFHPFADLSPQAAKRERKRREHNLRCRAILENIRFDLSRDIEKTRRVTP